MAKVTTGREQYEGEDNFLPEYVEYLIRPDHEALESHIDSENNPHKVTKAQVGLGNADNTSDMDKPVSTAVQAALAMKADKAAYEAHDGDDVRHITEQERTAWNGKVDGEPGKGLTEENYSAAEKDKLAAIEDKANRYVHPDSHPASMIAQSAECRFATDAEKAVWNSKANGQHTHDAADLSGVVKRINDLSPDDTGTVHLDGGATGAAGGMRLVVIPAGVTVPIDEREENTMYLVVTEEQSLPQSIAVSPNMGIEIQEEA